MLPKCFPNAGGGEIFTHFPFAISFLHFALRCPNIALTGATNVKFSSVRVREAHVDANVIRCLSRPRVPTTSKTSSGRSRREAPCKCHMRLRSAVTRTTDKSNILIVENNSDTKSSYTCEFITKKIEGYTRQDAVKNRKCDLTVEQVRDLIERDALTAELD